MTRKSYRRFVQYHAFAPSMRSRDARAAPRSRCVPALAHQSARLELCALTDPKITTSSHPGGTQCPSLTATQLRPALSCGDHHASHVRALLASHTLPLPRDILHACNGYRRVRGRPHRPTSRACEMHSGLLPTACSLRDQPNAKEQQKQSSQCKHDSGWPSWCPRPQDWCLWWR